MSGDTNIFVPQWLAKVAAISFGLIASACGVFLWWFFRKYDSAIETLRSGQQELVVAQQSFATIDSLQELELAQQSFATVQSLVDLGMRIAPMVSREELVGYLDQMRDEANKRDDRLREDRQRMHTENLDNIKAVRSDISDLREGVSNDIQAVHRRVDDLFKVQR